MSDLATRNANLSPAAADQLEADALEALSAVASPEDAELLLARIKLAETAVRLAEFGREREQRWGRVRLMAERRYGELLGPPEHGGPREQGSGAALTDAERVARQAARKLAAVPEPEFTDYVGTADRPTRAGLLRTAKPEPAPAQDDAELARHELVSWFAQGRVVKRLLDDGGTFKSLAQRDRESLGRDADLMAATAERVKGELSR